MAIDLHIPTGQDPVIRKFKLPESLAQEFDLYVEAAQETAPRADESVVLQAILERHLKRDRGFRTWLKERRSRPKGRGPGEEKATVTELPTERLAQTR